MFTAARTEGVSHNCLQIVLTYPQKRVLFAVEEVLIIKVRKYQYYSIVLTSSEVNNSK